MAIMVLYSLLIYFDVMSIIFMLTGEQYSIFYVDPMGNAYHFIIKLATFLFRLTVVNRSNYFILVNIFNYFILVNRYHYFRLVNKSH